MTCGIYLITCSESDRVYVGQSMTIEKRFSTHRRELALGEHHCVLLQRAHDKYGASAFKYEIAEIVPKDKTALCKREQWFIDMHEGRAFNTALVAESVAGIKHSAEACQRVRSRWATPEFRAKMKEAFAKRDADPTFRQKMSEGKKRAFAENPQRRQELSERGKKFASDPAVRADLRARVVRWRTLNPEAAVALTERMKLASKTPEAFAKKSEAQKRRFARPEEKERKSRLSSARFADPAMRERLRESASRRIRCIDTGEEFRSAVEASKKTGLGRSALAMHLCGINKSVGGMKFEYV